MSLSKTPQTPEAALRTSRIIWAALLMGQVMFLLVVLALARNGEPDARLLPTLTMVAAGMMSAAAAAAWFLRRTFMGDRPVPPAKYVGGTILGLAVMEGAVILSLVLAMITRTAWPFAGIAIAGIALQALLFPRGTELH